MKGYSLHRWGAYVLGKECLYPYVADPYSDPAALGFWPPYSAPVAGTRALTRSHGNRAWIIVLAVVICHRGGLGA